MTPIEPQIKVTQIKNRWHARLILEDKILDEMACELKCDIGWISREMLRWFSKLGGESKFADSARSRQTEKPTGKIWWKKDL